MGSYIPGLPAFKEMGAKIVYISRVTRFMNILSVKSWVCAKGPEFFISLPLFFDAIGK